jgi:AcrR family transcriptional regulator
MVEALPRERERADARRNRERILTAASRLVSEQGIDAVSMDAVATAACVGKGTVYRRFSDCSELLRALVEEPEREFQESVIRGKPPLGPGAPPIERLHAFGAGLIDLLEQTAHFISAKGESGDRYSHPAYLFHQTHLSLLLREMIGEGTRTDYVVDALLAPLGADAFLHEREGRGMSVQEMTESWCALATAVISSASSKAGRG